MTTDPNKPKRPYIKDKQVFKAVSFAEKIMNDPTKPKPKEVAIAIASKYYSLNPADVACYFDPSPVSIEPEEPVSF